VKGLSVRSSATALTMSSYLTRGIFVVYFELTQTTTIKLGRTCH
jgi:hypothetical protein